MRRLLFVTLLFATPAAAEVYQWTDADGRTHYSDTPVAGADRHASGNVSAVGNPDYNMKNLNGEIPYRGDGTAMIVEGAVNGVPMRFVVDTGATLVVIPTAVAREAGIRTSAPPTVTLQTANGPTTAPLVQLETVKVGKLQRTSIQGTVQNISSDPRLGLLGLSFLGAYRMTIDHQRQLIMLEQR